MALYYLLLLPYTLTPNLLLPSVEHSGSIWYDSEMTLSTPLCDYLMFISGNVGRVNGTLVTEEETERKGVGNGDTQRIRTTHRRWYETFHGIRFTSSRIC